MVYEGPFENPELCDLPYIMCGLPKNWERLASRDLLDTINSVSR